MIKAPRNTMATVSKIRDDVGPHTHDWQHVGYDAQGEEYQICLICDARRCVKGARFQAFRQDWLEYREGWAPAATPAEADDDEEDDAAVESAPIKRGPGRPRKIRDD